MYRFIRKDVKISGYYIGIGFSAIMFVQFISFILPTTPKEAGYFLNFTPWIVGLITLSGNCRQEKKNNSLEMILSLPVPRWHIVFSKFLLLLETMFFLVLYLLVSNMLIVHSGVANIKIDFPTLITSFFISFSCLCAYILIYFKFNYNLVQYIVLGVLIFFSFAHQILMVISVSLFSFPIVYAYTFFYEIATFINNAFQNIAVITIYTIVFVSLIFIFSLRALDKY